MLQYRHHHNFKIMKNLLFAAVLLTAFTSCKKNETTVNQRYEADTTASVSQNNTLQTERPWVSKNQVFLDKFKIIELDFTKFSAPNYEVKSVGPSLTKEELQLFPKSLKVDSFIGEPDSFQAHSKFDINDNLIGLVARMPGEYSFTALKLFFYDKIKDEILPQYFEVADHTGDAGYSEKMTSWLFKDGNQLKSFSYHWTKIEKVEPDDPTRESRTDDYYIIKLSPEKMDTARVSKPDLAKYQKLLNQK